MAVLSSRPAIFGGGSTAAGVAALAWLACLGVGGRAVWNRSIAVDRRTPAVACDTPVEIGEPPGARLGCASERRLRACDPPARIGDRLHQTDGRWRAERRAMSATTRVLLGLPLDVNRASGADLMLIRGIGPSLAGAIIAERENRGPFMSIGDLERVRGIGPKSVERFRSELTVARGPPGTDD